MRRPENPAGGMTREVLKLRMSACVSTINLVLRRHRWKGRLDSTDEGLPLIKTRSELFQMAERTVKRINPNETPETIEVSIEHCSRQYLDLLTETGRSTNKMRR